MWLSWVSESLSFGRMSAKLNLLTHPKIKLDSKNQGSPVSNNLSGPSSFSGFTSGLIVKSGQGSLLLCRWPGKGRFNFHGTIGNCLLIRSIKCLGRPLL